MIAACAPNKYQRTPSSANARLRSRRTTAAELMACAVEERFEANVVLEIACAVLLRRPARVRASDIFAQRGGGAPSPFGILLGPLGSMHVGRRLEHAPGAIEKSAHVGRL